MGLDRTCWPEVLVGLERVRWVVDAPEPTTLALVGLSESGQATYSFYVQGTADRGLQREHLPVRFPDEVAALHLGSLAIVLEPGASTLEQLVERERGRRVVSLDPNVRPAVVPDRNAYRQRLERLVGGTDVVRLSRDDLAWLDPAETAATAERWLAMGTALVVVTEGDDGATAYHRSGDVSIPPNRSSWSTASGPETSSTQVFRRGCTRRAGCSGMASRRSVRGISPRRCASRAE